jgi:hypothetical protein
MRLFAALALFVATMPSAHALVPAPAPTSAVHVGLSDSGEYIVTVSHDGQPATLWVRSGVDLMEVSLRFVGSNLHCAIARTGTRPFSFEGDVEPSRGRAIILGRFPSDKGPVDLKLRVTDSFGG